MKPEPATVTPLRPELRDKRLRDIRQRAKVGDRNRDPLTVTGVGEPEYAVFDPPDHRRLNIDESYQRMQIRLHVNQMISILESGGEIPEPIAVARRPGGTLWIVDGQQRYWAHWHAQKPLRALIYDVQTLDQERQLFIVMNKTKAVSPGWKVRAWPGPSRELLLWMANGEDSPYQGRIVFGEGGGRQTAHDDNVMRPVVASIIVKGLGCALTDGKTFHSATDRIETTMEKIDRLIRTERERTYKVAKMYGVLLNNTFGNRRPGRIEAIALGFAAAQRWAGLRVSDAWPLPTNRENQKLAEFPWVKYAPSSQAQWIPVLVPALLRVWK